MSDVVITEVGPLYTLDEVKSHLHVDSSDDDVTIQAYMDAAEKSVLQYCNIALVPLGAESVFKVAALMVVSDLYENRSGGEGLPKAAQLLINPYRWLRV
ncbi:head-tail connector protein [Neorhizobium alkalisoli]|uniref:Putative phage protein (Predicted DNA packaging) n=1 Tax=Neorhizobium alkalisoli TaxID=528178 RepID=A0A561QSF0_9HYPH|nr:head-tail connector protein [Neorhizobium alkalisoli]TWF53259.1 putative phage protein (predicted DNA packaging) [Neorhizobium alkalisoli]